MNKSVSFCLYGDQLKYYIGAEKNILLNKALLPDWETVIYYSPYNFLKEYEEKLKILGARLIDVNTIDLIQYVQYPMFWRYFVFFESGISIIRDLDSRMSEREATYIRNWEKSGKEYFIIRDHPWHSLVPGGLVGLKLGNTEICNFFINFVKTNGLGWGTDQEMLQKFFENVNKENIYYCGFNEHTNYIPRTDKNFFIGMQLDENDKPLVPNAVLSLDFLKSLNL